MSTTENKMRWWGEETGVTSRVRRNNDERNGELTLGMHLLVEAVQKLVSRVKKSDLLVGMQLGDIRRHFCSEESEFRYLLATCFSGKKRHLRTPRAPPPTTRMD